MLDAIYTSLTGLSGYSRGLGVVSNNVANLNTPGFKGAQLQFADLYYKDRDSEGGAHAQVGAGLTTGSSFLNLQTGESRATGNDLDLMIDGPGLFVLRNGNGQLMYTRAGQFAFDREGVLVDRGTRARVSTIDASGTLSDIRLDGLRTSAARQTSSVNVTGILSSDDVQHVVDSVEVRDSTGQARVLRLTFDNISGTTPDTWRVTVTLADGTALGTGELHFTGTRPDPAQSSVAIAYTPAAGGAAINFTLGLSADSQLAPIGADSTLQLQSQDGRAAGSLVKTTFDEEGYFTTTYSNGETARHGRLALSWFSSPDDVEQLGNNLFAYRDGRRPEIGNPHDNGYGSIKGGTVELSNVDLAKQFSELIITQRGYQASSQVITTANDMIQQLLDMRSRR